VSILEDIFLWFWSCIKAVPEGIVTGVITSLIFLLFRKILNKCGEYFSSIYNFLIKLQSLLGKQPEIGLGYQIIQSPKYSFTEKKRRNSVMSNDALWGILFFVIIAVVAGILALKKYQNIIQITIYAISAFFISSGIFFICVSAFTNKIQRSTLLYCIFGILLSFYTYYNAKILPTLISEIPSNFSVSFLLSNPKEGWPHIYMFGGLFITILEILLILLLLFRMICIKIDSLKSFRTTRYLIYKTETLDSSGYLVFFMVFLTIMSYILTSGLFIDFTFKMQKM
jgi:Ca2+/Na+ antiporter